MNNSNFKINVLPIKNDHIESDVSFFVLSLIKYGIINTDGDLGIIESHINNGRMRDILPSHLMRRSPELMQHLHASFRKPPGLLNVSHPDNPTHAIVVQYE